MSSAPSTSAISSVAPVFEADRLSKFYGAARGVEDISISIRPGEIFGFLGPNGAGKTTVIRSALGLLRPTSGVVRLFGDPVRTHSCLNHERLGYLPADLRLWSRMTARRMSDLMLGMAGGRPDRSWRDSLAERLELSLDRKFRNLSLGNRQKAGLLLALQHRPELVILDEPTSGLDPLVRRTVTEILLEIAAGGTTIIYSSHNLNEVEEMCSRVGILRGGRLVALKSIAEIRAEREQRLVVRFAPDEDAGGGTVAPDRLPGGLDGFRVIEHEGSRMEIGFRGSPDELLRWLAGHRIEEITSPPISLEEAFLSYYHDDAVPAA